jgi:chromosomal replication initiator protein
MTSDRPPGEIAKLEERLKSRFGAGLIVDIGQPDWEMRTAILLIKAGQRGVNLPMEAAQLIADQVEGIRELQGFLTRIITDAEIHNTPITTEKVRELLRLPSGVATARVVTPNEVIEAVAKHYDVGVGLLKGERRTKTIAWPRQVLMYFLAHEVRLPLTEVGRLLGGRDHSTVIHARDKILAEVGANPMTKNELDSIRKRIFGGLLVNI